MWISSWFFFHKLYWKIVFDFLQLWLSYDYFITQENCLLSKHWNLTIQSFNPEILWQIVSPSKCYTYIMLFLHSSVQAHPFVFASTGRCQIFLQLHLLLLQLVLNFDRVNTFWDFEKNKTVCDFSVFQILAKNHIFDHIFTHRISESELKPGRYSPTSYLWDKTIWRPIITIVLWPLLIEIPNFHENYFSSQFFFILYHLSLKIAVTLLFYDYKRKHLCLSYDNNQLVFKIAHASLACL